MSIQSDKKNFPKNPSSSHLVNSLRSFLADFRYIFRVYRRDNFQIAKKYVQGLLMCEKGQANMERMEEEVDAEYRAYQHFISNSKWDYKELLAKISLEVSQTLEENKKKTKVPTGYIIDETAHLKKGKASVGVGKQYAGVAGKIENCQVAVYSSLVNATRAALINERLFLPKKWISSPSKCDKAKIPLEERVFKTKPELALEMIDEDLERGVTFDWIGGDGLYGHNQKLLRGLEDRGLFYVLDVHSDELIYLEKPQVHLPSWKGKGRRPTKRKAEGTPWKGRQYYRQLQEEDWQKVKVRKTTKGWKKVKVHVKQVWVWDREIEQAIKRTLIITKSIEKKPKVKYSISSGAPDQYTPKEYAYFQAQRYWVERTFDDGKNELGLSDYQIRKWIGWHHHQALVMLAGVFLLKEKIQHEEEHPLMSVRDARILTVVSMFGTQQDFKKRIEQMKKRHLKRKDDINFNYRIGYLENST